MKQLPTKQDVINVQMETALMEYQTAKRRRDLVEQEWRVAQAIHENFTAINQQFSLPGDPGPAPE